MDRRAFLRAAGLTGAVLLPFTRQAFAAPDPALAPFLHGVASGDPLPDGVILWTRMTPEDPAAAARVVWVVATDPELSQVVRAGEATTDASRDHTVKVDVRGLAPATTYYYAFVDERGRPSLPGRTRTAPMAGAENERLRLALVSCSNYSSGYFNPYARLAERSDLDLVVHVGDYFYELGGGGLRPHDPPREIVALDDYRRRYAQYRLDPSLRDCHRQHPWVAVWDDHESANNSWEGGAAQHQPATEGDWQVRKRASIRAYLEWMPVREVDAADPLRIWRPLRFGTLVDLLLLDTRLYGRNVPGTDTGVTGEESEDPARTMLGPVQKAWLKERLTASAAGGTAWRLLGQQTMISPHRNVPTQVPIPYLLDDITETLGLGLREGGGNEGSDNWGAYLAERDELIAFLRDGGITDNVVLTGDIHTAWGCDVTDDVFPPTYEPATGAGSVGVELVCMSVTSHNLQETTMEDDAVTAINEGIVAANPNVAYTDQSGHGYVLVDVDRERVQAEWWETGTALVESDEESLEAVCTAERGTDHLVRAPLATPSDGRSVKPALAPSQPVAPRRAPARGLERRRLAEDRRG